MHARNAIHYYFGTRTHHMVAAVLALWLLVTFDFKKPEDWPHWKQRFDSKLSQRLQMDAELTLVKATKLVRQSEAVQAQQRIVKGPKTENLSAEVGQMGGEKRIERCPL